MSEGSRFDKESGAAHIHRCMSCGARWYCPHQSVCKANEDVLPSLVLSGPDGPTVFHHVCRNRK